MKKKLPFILAVFTLVGVLVGFSQLPRIFSKQGVLDLTTLTGNYNATSQNAIFNSKKVPAAPLIAKRNPDTQVLGENSSNKRIEVDLTNQRLYAYEGDTKVFDFLVSTGKWGRTPTGTFRIWTKLRYTLMTGGSQALGTYYYLPNVPYTMFFYNEETPKHIGFGIHGTYWHDNFGHPMSHGCVNMKTEEVEQLFYWANPELNGNSSIYATKDNPGTEIIIYGEAPNE